METLRLATPEEIEGIRDRADLTPASGVLAVDGHLAVVRQCIELDPVFFEKGSSVRNKAAFMRQLETMLRLGGATEFYFNAEPNDTTWTKAITSWGAIPVFKRPNMRFKRAL